MGKIEKEVKLIFQKEDFLNNEYAQHDDCAVSRASRRHFNVKKTSCCSRFLTVYEDKFLGKRKLEYELEDGFGPDEFDDIHSNYIKGEYCVDSPIIRLKLLSVKQHWVYNLLDKFKGN